MTITLNKFKKELSDISLLDKLRSKIFKSPSTFSSMYCEI
jgi:hypothetical protein